MSKSFSQRDIYLCTIIISLLLSALVLLHRQPVNGDGILYLQAAKVFNTSGLKASMHIYPWPFYQIMVALLAKSTSVSMLTSAYIINAVLMALASAAFVFMVAELGAERRVLWFALLTISISHYFNHYRADVIRDYGYLLFAQLAFIYFMRALRDFSWTAAILWNVCIILAMLFRIEAAYFACCLPCLNLLQDKLTYSRRLLLTFKLSILFILGGLGLLVWLSVSKHHQLSELGRLSDLFYQVYRGLQQAQAYLIGHYHQLNSLFKGELDPSMLCLLISLAVLALVWQAFIYTIEWPYLILALYTLSKRLIKLDRETKLTFSSIIVLNVIMCVFFAAKAWFVSTRFIAISCLLLMAFVPFAIDKVVENWQQPSLRTAKSSLCFVAMVLALIYLLIAGLGHFGPSKTYLVDAGQWLNQHYAEHDKVLANDQQFIFYVNQQNISLSEQQFWHRINGKDWQQYQFIGYQVGHNEQNRINDITKQTGLTPIKEFSSKRGSKIYIFANEIK